MNRVWLLLLFRPNLDGRVDPDVKNSVAIERADAVLTQL